MNKARLNELRLMAQEGTQGRKSAAIIELAAEVEKMNRRSFANQHMNFAGPSLSMVITLAQKEGMSTDMATEFYDHHQTYGWKGKKGKIVDVSAALRTWKRNDAKFNPPPANGSKGIGPRFGVGS